MIDYKYPDHSLRGYFKKTINEEQGRKFRVHYQWQAPENKLNIYSHRGRWSRT
jgi:hypothetical protein